MVMMMVNMNFQVSASQARQSHSESLPVFICREISKGLIGVTFLIWREEGHGLDSTCSLILGSSPLWTKSTHGNGNCLPAHQSTLGLHSALLLGGAQTMNLNPSAGQWIWTISVLQIQFSWISSFGNCYAVKANEAEGFEMLSNFPLPFWKYIS